MAVRKPVNVVIVVAVVATTAILVGASPKKVTCDNCARCAGKEIKRVGMVIGLNRDMEAKYRELHADSHPGQVPSDCVTVTAFGGSTASMRGR